MAMDLVAVLGHDKLEPYHQIQLLVLLEKGLSVA